jgi:hypothetical protein
VKPASAFAFVTLIFIFSAPALAAHGKTVVPTSILIGDCRDVLRTLEDESVQCVVTSPPYWGLRDYGVKAGLWGGDAACKHQWGAAPARGGGSGKQGAGGQRADRRNIKAQETKRITGDFCRRCGAWRGVFGLEPTYHLYVEHAVEIFREVWRVLRKDGTLWLNLGDCYATNAGAVGRHPGGGVQGGKWKGWVGNRPEGPRGGHEGKHGYPDGAVGIGPMTQPNRMPQPGLRAKNLVGMPWRVALALQDDGWILRRDIIWHKPAPMPESVRDRCTTSHEYLFHFVQEQRHPAVGAPRSRHGAARLREARARLAVGAQEDARGARRRAARLRARGLDAHQSVARARLLLRPRRHHGAVQPDSHARAARGRSDDHKWADGGPGPRGQAIARVPPPAGRKIAPHDTDGPRIKNNDSYDAALRVPSSSTMRNKRSVWTVGSEPFSEAHFATFPPGTDRAVHPGRMPTWGRGARPIRWRRHDRPRRRSPPAQRVLIELNPKYAAMAEARIHEDRPALFAAPAAADRQQLSFLEAAE